MPDFGLTHIALVVTDMDRSVEFYAKYADTQVVHRRPQSSLPGKHVVWISDRTRPFVIVLLQDEIVSHPLRPYSHLGFACRSTEEFRRKCELARNEGVLVDGPHDSGPPVGQWVFLNDPDGHTLELSFGQEVQQAVIDHDPLL